MKCEIHGPYEGPDCQWCVKDEGAIESLRSMTWQCDMCGQFTSQRTIGDHKQCDSDRYQDELDDLRRWTYR